jgi:predicted GIY-YIG superfamily endonuclease
MKDIVEKLSREIKIKQKQKKKKQKYIAAELITQRV